MNVHPGTMGGGWGWGGTPLNRVPIGPGVAGMGGTTMGATGPGPKRGGLAGSRLGGARWSGPDKPTAGGNGVKDWLATVKM